ncbi:MAG: NUDIX domain-containing protein [Thermodesulfobacteriota bacterium]
MTDSEVFRFCPICGGSLETRMLKPGQPERFVCAACNTPLYLDPKLVACSIVEIHGSVVLLRRGIQPRKGFWVMPGGYVDRGETVQAAALRETEEECGLRTRIRDLLGIYSYPGEIVAVVVYTAERISGSLFAGDETTEARLVRPEEIPWAELAFPSTLDALTDYCLRKRTPS